MSGPRIKDSEPREDALPLPRLPRETDRLLSRMEGGGEWERGGWPRRSLAALIERRPGWLGSSLLLSFFALCLAATALTLALRAPAGAGLPVAVIRPSGSSSPELVVLGRGGAGVIDCHRDSVDLFLAAEPEREAVVAVLEGRYGSLFALMSATSGGFRAYLDAREGFLRVRGRDLLQELRLTPGDQLLVRVNGLSHAGVIRVLGEAPSGSGSGAQACSQAGRTAR